MVCLKFTPQDYPFPFDDHHPHLIHPFLDRPHSPPQTASGSNRPFCHSTLPDRQTDRWDSRQVCKKSVYALLIVSDALKYCYYMQVSKHFVTASVVIFCVESWQRISCYQNVVVELPGAINTTSRPQICAAASPELLSPCHTDRPMVLNHPCHVVLYKLAEELAVVPWLGELVALSHPWQVVSCARWVEELVVLSHPCHAVLSSAHADELNHAWTSTDTQEST